MARLRGDAVVVGEPFALVPRVIEVERQDAPHYGICYEDGTIRIRLRHATTGRFLSYSSLIDTLCHELAHLRHLNHGPRFQSLFADVLALARERGIYRPKSVVRSGACGLAPAPIVAEEEAAEQLVLLPPPELEVSGEGHRQRWPGRLGPPVVASTPARPRRRLAGA